MSELIHLLHIISALATYALATMAGLSTGAPIVKVYHSKSMILPDVSRVLACLYEKDIKFETHTASSYKNLLRLQASNHVSVPFYDGPTFLEESREICRYIAETYEHRGYPFLLGKDSLERASIEQWLHHEEHAFDPPSRALFCHLAFPFDEEDDDIDLQKRKLEEVLEVYDQRLSDSEFLAGNKFTLADLVHLPNSHYITESDKFVYLYDSRKNVQRWWNAISTRDSWQKVLKDIKKVELQCEQEELKKKQQQQRQTGHPTTTRRQIRLDSRMHTSTKSQTILVPPPVGIISTAPMASQAEKPHPTETSPDETPVSSSLSTPTTHKSSAVQSKHVTISTTHRETPQASVQSAPRIPKKSPIPVQRISNSFNPATSPTTAEKPPRIDAGKSSTRDVSIPSEDTETDLPTKSKPRSTKEVSNNLRVFDFYKASSHTDEAEPYIEPTPQKTSEMLDKFSETDGLSDATVNAKTSPRSAKEGSDQLSASGFYKSDNSTANSADSEDKESARYTERTPRRPAETIYGRSTVQRATDASPGKLRSTEAHQKLQAEQWYAATAGLSNLKGETDYLMPTQQVNPSKDVQQYSPQDSEQASTHPLAQEPVSTDSQLVQGPEMTTRTPYIDQKRDVSSMLWRQAADVRGIAEDKASSDHRGAVLPPYTRKHAEEAKIASADWRKHDSLPKHVTDDAAQAIPFRPAYDDAHDTTQEARETASAPRRTRAQDAHDTSEGIGTYHSASSRSQPIDAPQDATPPSKQTTYEGSHRATTPYPGAQELIKQARESPASRLTVPHDAQGSTEEEETVESSSSRAQLLDSHLADACLPKQFLDEDGYGPIAPLQTGYTDDQYNRKQDRATAAPRQMRAQGAFEEKKIADPASFKAQTFGYRQTDAPPQKQPLAEDPRATTPLQKRYSGNEDATKQSKHASSRSKRMAAQEVRDNFEQTKAGDPWSSREQPSDTWQAPGPLPRHEVDDARSTTAPFQTRYPDTGGTAKEVEDVTSMPRRMAGEDAQETFEETKFADSASSRAQPLDYHITDAPSRKQEAIEDPPGATSPSEKRYADAGETIKHSRETAFKPRKMVGQDAQDASEEAEARNSALFRAQPPDALGQKQSPDSWRAATTPSKQAAAEDALSVSQSSPTRYPRAEQTSKQPRAAASIPVHIAAQDARDAFRKSKFSDSRSSIEQPSDARAAAPLPKQELPDARSTTALFQKRYSDTKGTSKEAKVTFEETKIPDAASSRVQPLDSQRADATSQKKEATEDPRRATSPFKKRHSDVEGTPKQSKDNVFKARQTVGQDAQGTYEETKAGDFTLLREQSSDTWQAATTPTEQLATQDGPSLTPPSEKGSPSDEDTIKGPRGTASAPTRTTAQDANGTFQDSKPSDSVSARQQPLRAWQPVVNPPRQEIEDSHSTTSAFQKSYPYVEDSTRQAGDTAFAPTQIGAEETKDVTEETKVADSASSSAKPTYTPRTALPLSEQAEAEEDARDKGTESRETIPAPKKMVWRDAQGSYGERKTTDSTSTEQSLDNAQASSPLRQAAAKDARGATRGARELFVDETKHSQGVKDTTKKSVGTFEETKGLGSTFPTAQSLGAQDAQHNNGSSRTPTADQRKDASTQLQPDVQDIYKQPKSSSAHRKDLASSPSQAEAGNDDQAIMGEKIFSTEQLRQESQSTSAKAQPTDSRGPIKVERTPSVYQEGPLVAQVSHEQAQTLPTGVRADGATPKRRQAPVVPSTSEEKSTPSAPPRDHSTEEPFKRDTVDDRKEAPPLLVQEPTSGVQHASELLQEAAPDGDVSSKLSTIDQWRRASEPLQDVTPNSGDDLLGVSTIGQKPIPTREQAIPSVRGANEMIKRSVEQRVEPPAPIGAQTSDVQRAPPSSPGAVTVERAGEPVQMQSPTLDARPTSAATPTKRATHDGRETGDQEFVNTSDGQRSKASKASHDSAIIHEDVGDASLSTHGATVDDKAATSHASEAQGSGTWPDSTPTPVNVQHPTSDDELARKYLRDQGAQPPESTEEQTPLEAPRDSVSTQDMPSDGLARTEFAKPISTEGMSPTAGPASTLEAQLAASLRAEAAHAEQKFAPSDENSARAAQPLPSVESRKEYTSVPAADQTKTRQSIFRQQSRPPAPITREIPSSDTQHDTRRTQEVTLDNLPTDDSTIPLVPSHEQVSHAPQTFPDQKDMTPAPRTRDSPASDTQLASAKVQEVIPNNYRTDEGQSPDAHSAVVDKETTKSPSRQAPVLEARPDSTPTNRYIHPTSGDEPGILPDQGAESPTAAQATYSKDLRNSASTQDIPANALGNFKKLGPHSTAQEAISSTPGQASDLVAQPDSAKGEVSPATKKFSPSDQDPVHSAAQPSPAEPGKEDTKIREVDHDIDLDKSVPSQEKVSQAGHTSESHEGLTPHVHSSIVHDKTTTIPASLTSISDAALDSTPTSSDVQPTSGIEPGAEPPSGKQAPQLLKALDSMPSEDIPADASGEAQSMRSSVSADDQRGRPGEVALAEQKFSPSDQDSAHSIQPPFSAEPRNEDIKDSARSAQPLLSAAPDQTKDSQTTIAQQDISPALGTSKSPSSDQDSAHSAQKPSSSEPRKEQSTVTTPDQAKASQIIFGQQDIVPALNRTKNPSSDSQHASQKLQEIPPEDHCIDGSIPSQEQVPRVGHVSESGEGPTPDTHGAIVEEPMAHTTGPTSAPHAEHGMAPDQDSDQYSQPLASVGPRKEETGLVASDQTMAQQTIFGHQVITPAPGTSEASGEVLEVSPGDRGSSELTEPLSPSQRQVSHAEHSEPHEGPNPDVHGAVVDENTAQPVGSQAHSLEAGPNFKPADGDVHPTSGDEPVTGLSREQETQSPPVYQASIPPEALPDSVSTKKVSADAYGKAEPLKATGEVTPADQNIAPSEPLSSVESRKEDSNVVEAEQSEVSEPIIAQQDIGRAPGISDLVLDDDHNKESVSRKEQVSHDQRASEPREGSSPDVHGTFVNKKTTTPSSQAQSSDAKRDSSPILGDTDPSSGDQSKTRFLPDQGAKRAASTKSPPPLEALHYSESTHDVPADALGKAKSLKPPSVDQEVMSPTAVPDTQQDTARGEVAPDEQNYALPGQDLARPAQQPFSAEPTKEQTIVAASDQTSGAQTIIGQQDRTPATDKVSLGGHASEPQEGTTTDSNGAHVDDKITTSPSPVTSSLHNPQAQSPPTTQALPVEALGGPAFIQNIRADSLQKVEPSRPPSTDQEVMAPITGLAPAPDALQSTAPGEVTPAEQKFTPLDQDLTHSTRSSPPVESRKQVSNVAKANRTNVSRSSTGPDAVPSEAGLRELTESAKSLLPMTGRDPAQPPHEASIDLSSDGKISMIKGDQANTISNVNLSASQAVGQSESSAVKGALSEEKSKQQQQTDQSNPRSSQDDSIEFNNLTTSGDIQPSPPKKSMEATEESRNQQQADQAVFQSTQENEKQVEETETQDTGRDEPEEMNLDENTNQKNNGTSQGEALEQSGEHVPGVQLQSKNTNSGFKSTKDAPSGIQTDNISESSLRTSEESKQQVQTEGRTQGGETKAPASKTEQPKESDLPASNKSITSPSQAEASDKSEEQTSPGIQNGDNNSSKLDGSTNDTKSDDMEDNPSS